MAILQTALGRLIAIIQQVGLDQGADGATLLGHGEVIISMAGLWGHLFNCRHIVTACSPNTVKDEDKKKKKS